MGLDVEVNESSMDTMEENKRQLPPQKGVPIFVFSDEVKPHAEALGGLVIMIGGLELQLSILLNVMLDIEFTPKGDVLGVLEMKRKVQLLRGLAVVVGKDMPNNWHNRLMDLLNRIEGLSEERNRMIHDVWGLSDTDGDMIRIRLKPAISKKPLELRVSQIPVSAPDIANLSYRILGAIRELVTLAVELKPSMTLKSP